ncbi:MAG: bifunctional UDP-N-acetylmuramoyl-L-alanyl-D-glutamate--2,6-diaminopimelate ligase MurE/UDP-N-acetylmuramoyl-tripeptide--D-alanyl-D-alanine ligase MurF, partial [Candidimonas sp.]
MNADAIVAWLSERVDRTRHLCLDSRGVTPGDVFVACPGHATDGRRYLNDAVDRGAAAIVMLDGWSGGAPSAVPVLAVVGLTSLLGEIADAWYGQPSAHLLVIAVTGTNGKTSTVQWLAAALNAHAVPCGVIGTLGVTQVDGATLAGVLTTPDVLSVHRSLAALLVGGAVAVAVEASSIGLDQGRLDGVRIAVAGFTNLTRDHLDYHGTIEKYRDAKFSLFARPELRIAVVNVDDAAGRDLLVRFPALRVLRYSMDRGRECDIRAVDIETGAYGVIFNLMLRGATAQVVTRQHGLHNVSNFLLVAGVLHHLGWDLARIAGALAALPPVPGRLETIAPRAVRSRGAVLVVVDYAHTPDALDRALVAMREVAVARRGRLICVFGCGGDRDAGKRPIMGQIAGRLADRVVLTDDNPRSEEPRAIIEQIAAGMSLPPTIEPDRAAAILATLWGVADEDVVLLAGKGHETYQEFRGGRVPFDDRQWAGFALTWRYGGRGVSVDSRSIQPGQWFIALAGEKFDGHDYLAQVASAGACAAVVARADPAVAIPQFVLGDTRVALARIGAAWRGCHDLPVIAVTGSNGKTTTKEMIAAILRAWLGAPAVLATQGNMNNDIGVPLMLLRLANGHRAAVFELGMNHPGEIEVLAGMARPTVALVNNAQREHQEFMHTVEAVARENGSVISALPASGIAVFPGDDIYASLWRGLAGERAVARFGLAAACEVHAEAIHVGASGTSCRLVTPWGDTALSLAVPGLHNLRNALAAAACAGMVGAPLEAMTRGLAGFTPVHGRMMPRLLDDGLQLIDDTYNANPDSVRAAVDVLAALPGKRILVLGDMAEVGTDSPALHGEVGAYACERGVDALLT